MAKWLTEELLSGIEYKGIKRREKEKMFVRESVTNKKECRDYNPCFLEDAHRSRGSIRMVNVCID